MKEIPYKSVVDNLMYLAICTRPNIAFVANVLRRYLANPSHGHWVTAKKVLKYLCKTKDYMLVYKHWII